MEKLNGAIGIFDSGFGGLTILNSLEIVLPGYNFIYLGDNARAPYGCRPAEEIFQFTLQGVEKLFALGAELVVLACNTASAQALRRIQQEILPIKYPNKRVLGIIIPTVEEAYKASSSGHVGVLATEATVRSGAFESEMLKINQAVKMTVAVGGRMAEFIEQGKLGSPAMACEVSQVVSGLVNSDKHIDVVVLGCTHYPLAGKLIEQNLPIDVSIIDQGLIVAQKLKEYLQKHDQVTFVLRQGAERAFYTTSNSQEIISLFPLFYGKKIVVGLVELL